MIPLRLSEIATSVGGLLSGDDATVTGVCLDSRQAAPGDLFVALPGEHVDGADFVSAAFAAGAVGALTERAGEGPRVVVSDVGSAFGALASHVRSKLPGLVVVGITGSSGKTSTKDLLAQLLEPTGPTVSPVASYNNEVGLPRTVLRADAATRFLVLEYGARGGGHIAALCRIVRPDVALVLNVGTAHIGEFGSQAAIAAAKGELVAGIAPGGTAVLNSDDPLVAAMAERAPSGSRILTFGAGGQVEADRIVLDAQARAAFRLLVETGVFPGEPGGAFDVRLRLHGPHHVLNALAAATAAISMGVRPADVAQRLSEAVPRSTMRMAVSELAGGVTLVNDAYNANPESMAAALRALAVLGEGRRRWAVLGEMLELGGSAADAHTAVGELAAVLGIDVVVAVGAGAHQIGAGARAVRGWSGEAILVDTASAAGDLLSDGVRSGDVVLVKASRAVGLELVAEQLERRSAP